MGAPDLLRHLRAAGFALALTPDRRVLVTPASGLTAADRTAIRTHRDELVQLLAEQDKPCMRQQPPWTDGEIESFTARHARLMAAGLTDDQAEALAERLVNRDRDGDDRRLCLECRHWRPGFCRNHRAAGLAVPELAAGWHELPQRCRGFEAVHRPIQERNPT